MADDNESLLREVKAEMERERLQSLWDKYGTYILAAAMAFVVGVAGYQYWQGASRSAAENAGAQYSEALRLAAEEEKREEAIKLFGEIAKDAPGGYGILAKLQVAASHLEAEKPDAALAAFEQAAADSEAPKLIRDYAVLQAASLRLGKADFTEMQNRLNGLISGQNPWRFSAKELLGLAQIRSGREEEARQTFEDLLAEPGVPPSLADRAQRMMAQFVAADVAEDVKAEMGAAEAGKAEAGTAETGKADGPKAEDQATGQTQDKPSAAGGELNDAAKTDGAKDAGDASGDQSSGGTEGDQKPDAAEAGDGKS